MPSMTQAALQAVKDLKASFRKEEDTCSMIEISNMAQESSTSQGGCDFDEPSTSGGMFYSTQEQLGSDTDSSTSSQDHEASSSYLKKDLKSSKQNYGSIA
jgi:hypothetical protein